MVPRAGQDERRRGSFNYHRESDPEAFPLLQDIAMTVLAATNPVMMGRERRIA